MMTSAALAVTLLRHGEVEGYAHAFLGERDPPLSAAGWGQLARALAAVDVPPVTAIACSPRVRCRAFAERLAAERSLALDVLPALAEMRFGEWEGLSAVEVEARDPARLAAFQADPSRTAPPGGEPYLDFAQRVRAGFAAWTRGRRGHALVVTHAGVIRALLGDCLDLAPAHLARIALPPAAVCLLSLLVGEPPVLLALNFAVAPCAA
jgi:broad specificity phosphatase PhoE